MSNNLIGRALIAQSGGPSAVINASLVGAIRAARAHRDRITEFGGSINGLEGCVKALGGRMDSVIDLFAQPYQTLKRIEKTPGAALGSSRKKVGKDISPRDVLNYMVTTRTRYFFYIGGNDSADNALAVSKEAKQAGYDAAFIHIPKTIDNDLRENDHTPGFGSAANFVASAVRGDDCDNKSLRGVKIDVIMGRHAGFLTASSALARRKKGDAPHLIYVPEITFDKKRFLQDVADVFKKYGRVIVAVSEGIEDENRVLLGWDGRTRDSHGNPELDSLYLGRYLARLVKKSGITTRVRADVFGYLQRSFPLAVSQVDREEAREVGAGAVEFALSGKREGSVAIKTENKKEYAVYYELVPLEAVARVARKMPRSYMNEAGNDVSQEFLDYAKPLVGKLPRTGELERKFI